MISSLGFSDCIFRGWRSVPPVDGITESRPDQTLPWHPWNHSLQDDPFTVRVLMIQHSDISRIARLFLVCPVTLFLTVRPCLLQFLSDTRAARHASTLVPPSIWRCHHSHPLPPVWSEANLPTPLCRILRMAVHEAAVKCHLALGSIVEELPLTSPLKLVCLRQQRCSESQRATCAHSSAQHKTREGWLTPSGGPLSRFSSQQVYKEMQIKDFRRFFFFLTQCWSSKTVPVVKLCNSLWIVWCPFVPK